MIRDRLGSGVLRRDTILGGEPVTPTPHIVRKRGTKGLTSPDQDDLTRSINGTRITPSNYPNTGPFADLVSKPELVVQEDSFECKMESVPVERVYSLEETKKEMWHYDFNSITRNKLGSMFAQNCVGVAGYSQLMTSTQATGAKANSNDMYKDSSMKKDTPKWITRGASTELKHHKSKPRTVIPTQGSNQELIVEQVRPARVVGIPEKKEQMYLNRTQTENSESAANISQPRNKVQVNYGEFLHRLTFSRLLEPTEKLIRDTIKEVVSNGVVKQVCCLTWDSGTVYEGDVMSMKFHGEGVFNHCSGYKIAGSFANGKVEGQARYERGRHTYQGLWQDNRPNGHGVERVENKYQYDGNFKDGLKSGKGKMIVFGKGKYEGEFSMNAFNGKGTFVWEDGKKYIGSWMSNEMHGKGVMTWPDGRRYDGRYARNKKEGIGTFQWADGRIFTGMWRNGKQHGPGKYTNLAGEKGQSSWNGGKRDDDGNGLEHDR